MLRQLSLLRKGIVRIQELATIVLKRVAVNPVSTTLRNDGSKPAHRPAELRRHRRSISFEFGHGVFRNILPGIALFRLLVGYSIPVETAGEEVWTATAGFDVAIEGARSSLRGARRQQRESKILSIGNRQV